ncbi:MAG: SDR family oxidoreductase [Treponema sp.]|jgi:NAD(P)-dependent dehydrogenase (short-subunit alcohol dehydrogenase family)|nr:SDR family oxidoreductase [Treponema sp.]
MPVSIAQSLEKLFSMENKVILLTGAAGGIGKVLAEGFASAGAAMALCDLDAAKLNPITDGINANGGKAGSYYLDLIEMESIKKCVDAVIADYGRIDVLVNCAGINVREGFLDVEESTYDRIMNINLKGLYFISQEAAKHMMKQKSGNILNIASHNSVGMMGGCSVYGASKSAVAALTRSMAIEWAQYGIRANALAPGHILTSLTTVTWEHPERSRYLRERIAMKRPGNPEELLGIALMLVSDASSYITGSMMHVDGGCLAGGAPWPYDTKY